MGWGGRVEPDLSAWAENHLQLRFDHHPHAVKIAARRLASIALDQDRFGDNPEISSLEFGLPLQGQFNEARCVRRCARTAPAPRMHASSHVLHTGIHHSACGGFGHASRGTFTHKCLIFAG